MAELVPGRSTVAQPSTVDNARYRWRMLWASIVGYAMDHLDMMILSFVMPSLIAAFGFTLAQGGAIATATFMGAVIGGYAFGIMADYIGRVRVFALTIIVFSVFTGLTVFAENLTHLCIFRFLAGLGIGGEFGIGMTLVTETWPKEKRARATAAVAVGGQFGTIGAALAAAFILPSYGWQGVFLVGTLPALFAAWSRYGLEEPEMWVKHNERKKVVQKKVANNEPLTPEDQEFYKSATKFPLTHLFKDKRATATTFGLTVMTSVQNFGYFGIMIWLPTILMQKHGLTLNKTTAWMVITILGMIAGMLTFGYFCDRLGRRPAFMTFQIASAAAVWMYANINDPTYLLPGGAILGFFANGMMAGYGALLSEHYTTEARSTAENFIFNSGRAVGGFAPLIVGSLAAQYTLSGALAGIAFIYIFAAITVYFLIPETKNKDLI